jgi:hypothetical protein
VFPTVSGQKEPLFFICTKLLWGFAVALTLYDGAKSVGFGVEKENKQAKKLGANSSTLLCFPAWSP